MKTFIPKEADIERKWYVVDAEGMVLGRLASQVASILRGKNKPEFTPFVVLQNPLALIRPKLSACLILCWLGFCL